MNIDPAHLLYDRFPSLPTRPWLTAISAEDLPAPFRKLLAHRHHMTVTVEEFYGGPVDVVVLESRREGDHYSRQILLTLRGAGTVVQFGIVSIDLHFLPAEVRGKIVEEKTPLGRILIENNVLTTVEPIGFYRVTPDDHLARQFGGKDETCYGRVGTITANGQPAITVLEILAAGPIAARSDSVIPPA